MTRNVLHKYRNVRVFYEVGKGERIIWDFLSWDSKFWFIKNEYCSENEFLHNANMLEYHEIFQNNFIIFRQ